MNSITGSISHEYGIPCENVDVNKLQIDCNNSVNLLRITERGTNRAPTLMYNVVLEVNGAQQGCRNTMLGSSHTIPSRLPTLPNRAFIVDTEKNIDFRK